MAPRRFKRLDDLTPAEHAEYLRNKTIPVIDPDEEEALRDAGYDPETRRPLAEVEAEEAQREAREAEIAELETLTPEQHEARQGRRQ